MAVVDGGGGGAEWWTHTEPCQRRLTDGPGGPWTDMTEVWHLD